MTDAYKVEEVLTEDGKSPFGRWFASLDPVAAAKVRVALARIERGNLSGIQWFRGIGEYKIHWGPGLRIYLANGGSRLILLLGGGTKRRQQVDIDRALQLWARYQSGSPRT